MLPTDAARALIARAQRVVIVTGAGVSAESGVPTFRGTGGLWKSFKAEDLATPQAFRRDPRLVWEWYGWRRELVAKCDPNAAHHAIARFAAARGGVTIVTQNVDGLHRRAAIGDATLLELHGSLYRMRCTSCSRRREGNEPIDATSAESLPRCDRCQSLMRPDIVWFGESLDPAILDAAFHAASNAGVCLVIGTSALVHPAASIPLATRDSGGAIIEVNPDETPLTQRSTHSIRGPAAKLVPQLLEHPA